MSYPHHPHYPQLPSLPLPSLPSSPSVTLITLSYPHYPNCPQHPVRSFLFQYLTDRKRAVSNQKYIWSDIMTDHSREIISSPAHYNERKELQRDGRYQWSCDLTPPKDRKWHMCLVAWCKHLWEFGRIWKFMWTWATGKGLQCRASVSWHSILDSIEDRVEYRYSILDSQYSILDSQYSILDTRYLRVSSWVSRLDRDCQLTFARYCT